jgi:alkylation response protein AidB-like acyl-CoA dehydrogenase
MWRLTDEERAFRDHVRDVVLEEIRDRVVELDDRSDYPQDIHDILARERLLGLTIPEEYGGRGCPRSSAAPSSRSSARSRARSP